MMKSANFLQAHAVTTASFSTWEYRHLVSVIDHEANATALQVDSDFCSNTAPRSNADVSAEIFVDAGESYRVCVIGLDSSCFTLVNAVDRAGPDAQDMDLLRSSPFRDNWPLDNCPPDNSPRP